MNSNVTFLPLHDADHQVIEAARKVIEINFDSEHERHTVGAAVLCGSGRIVSAVNVYANCGFGPCAETVLIGTAVSQGEREFALIAACGGPDRNFAVMSPCGNCRQILAEYAPEAFFIMERNGQLGKVAVRELLPIGYTMT